MWPFADFVDVADAYASGDRIEFQWQVYRAHKEFDLALFVEAAMREQRLRRMYPFRSMFWMSFRPTSAEYWVPGPWVRSAGEGRFTVVEDRCVEPDITLRRRRGGPGVPGRDGPPRPPVARGTPFPGPLAAARAPLVRRI